MSTPPIALTIAGSDSGGGAGIQADLTTMAALGAHGTSVITVVTAQNTVGVQGLHPLPALVVSAQLDSVVADLPPQGVKCGLLGTPELVELVAGAVDRGLATPVVDPVLVATSGDALTTGDVSGIVAAYRDVLVPRTRLLTPNTDEAAALLGGGSVETVAECRDAARALLALGAQAVVITGGVPEGECVDVLATAEGVTEHRGDAVPTLNDHGTGCTYSAAVASYLAHGRDVVSACEQARRFVRRQLEMSRDWKLGSGHGPVSHLPSSDEPEGES
ncbi:MAG: bifunctional hydroxymethylpyrimidine kinase/phosphomethylpyrimidine kinase [Propionibacteriales bacterium]|nr:bifunctional hydroxymethylpyrimidine kinase/phosphomethylpyrimidine kinase [Propionibacteriales bacterium]